ncbi:MAG TPA: hypothetical protein VF530_15480 [Planctomycetota bacterium]
MLASLAAFFVLGASSAPQANNTWSIIFDDPGSGGSQTTTITVSYTDSQGVKREKEISATAQITAADSSASKKEKVQEALNTELSKPENQVGGNSLAATGGTGGVMTITPSGQVPDAKIEDVETDDERTGEKDKVLKPTGKEGLAQVSLEGEVVGLTASGGPSVYEVDTNLGTASVQLASSMTRLQVLKALRDQLDAMGPKVVTWIDSEKLILFVLLKDDGIYTLGAGSTDDGLRAVCKVIATD